MTIEPLSTFSPGFGACSNTKSRGAWSVRALDLDLEAGALERSAAPARAAGRPRAAPRATRPEVRPATARTISEAGKRQRSAARSRTSGQRRSRLLAGAAEAGGGSSAARAPARTRPVSCRQRAAPCSSACRPLSQRLALKSSAVCQRCAGSLASAFITTASSAGRHVGPQLARSAAAARFTCLSATATALSPVERQPPGQHLEQHHADRVEVGRLGDRRGPAPARATGTAPCP